MPHKRPPPGAPAKVKWDHQPSPQHRPAGSFPSTIRPAAATAKWFCGPPPTTRPPPQCPPHRNPAGRQVHRQPKNHSPTPKTASPQQVWLRRSNPTSDKPVHNRWPQTARSAGDPNDLETFESATAHRVPNCGPQRVCYVPSHRWECQSLPTSNESSHGYSTSDSLFRLSKNDGDRRHHLLTAADRDRCLAGPSPSSRCLGCRRDQQKRLVTRANTPRIRDCLPRGTGADHLSLLLLRRAGSKVAGQKIHPLNREISTDAVPPLCHLQRTIEWQHWWPAIQNSPNAGLGAVPRLPKSGI